jgi:hypothetical protein
MHRHLQIISGGQTGVDRGALDAALELGAQCGGWCPDGRKAEDGRIPDRYPLVELPGAGYPERTRSNVADSDGTLIVHFGPLSAGTLLTLRICEELLKPVALIDAAEVSWDEGARTARAFIDTHDIHRLNVAGPRDSHWPEAHDYARDLIHALLKSTSH